MSRPRALLVDDSEAVLAFEAAALSGHFTVATALNGKAALAQLSLQAPDIVVLDLSMPLMNGEEVLAHFRSDPLLVGVPVLIVSAETERARACLAQGARAFLCKPIRADELLATCTRLVDERRVARRRDFLACLPLKVGAIEMAVAVDAVALVVPQVRTTSLSFGPPYLREVFELYGSPVLSVDLAARLGVEHGASLVERKLVVLRDQAINLALCVDDVSDPEEIAPEHIIARDDAGAACHSALRAALAVGLRTARGLIPLIEPRALVAPHLLDAVADWLASRREAQGDTLEAAWE